jgi:hypothetical protein
MQPATIRQWLKASAQLEAQASRNAKAMGLHGEARFRAGQAVMAVRTLKYLRWLQERVRKPRRKRKKVCHRGTENTE